MKVRKSLVLAGLAGGLGVATSAMAQSVIYQNTTTPLGSLVGAVAVNAANGAEVGDEVGFVCGPRQVSEITIIFHVLGSAAGTANTQVRLYEAGSTPSVATLLWDSGLLPPAPHTPGLNNFVLPVPNVPVGEGVIWTIQHTNRTGSIDAIGPRAFDPPTIGTSTPDFWARDLPGFPGWTNLVFTSGAPANFGARIVATGAVNTGACCLPDGTCAILSACACTQQQGLYQGDDSQCSQVFCRLPGACCRPIGTCFLTAQHVCEGQGGIFSGDGVACATANCPVPGACCLPGGECVTVHSDVCAMNNGTFRGAGTICGPENCATPPVLFNNGPLSTGDTTSGFGTAPAGTTWSEIASIPGCANTLFGFSAVGANRVADNFTIPTGESWTINKIDVFAYQTLTAPQTPPITPFTAGNIRIWSGFPNATGSTIVFGDTTTNRLASSTFSNIYRTPAAGTLLRPVFRNELTVSTTLPAGTYWIDYNLTVTGTGGFTPPVTLRNTRGPAGANAVQQTVANGPWNPLVDVGACNIPRAQDAPFIVYGQVGACYANCDQSTQQPILNVDDFTCFINAYAAAQFLPPAQQLTHYANCDGSTVHPVLNVDDFTCFINAYSVGCLP
jgi:hypothetical protein